MRKFLLNVDALVVETFSAGTRGRYGTVRANEDTGYEGYDDTGPDFMCYEAMPTDERDSCELCSNPPNRCVNLSLAGPTWCPRSACV